MDGRPGARRADPLTKDTSIASGTGDTERHRRISGDTRNRCLTSRRSAARSPSRPTLLNVAQASARCPIARGTGRTRARVARRGWGRDPGWARRI